MTRHPKESRAEIINAVRNPLGFLVLSLLAVEAAVTALAWRFSGDNSALIWTAILSVPAFVLTVVTLAVWRPEALRGDRPLQEAYAKQLASDLYIALDGPLRNLERKEREEAWLTVADVITNDSQADQTYSRFCSAVAAKLKKLADLSNRGVNTQGRIEP
jgi:hypothetical protein